MQDGDGTQFLTVEEAAKRLGQSRLRVREAVARGLLTGRRDNEGRLRVDLPDGLRLVESAGALEPEDMLSFLFDEIEELEGTLADRDALIARMGDLASAQAEALDRADAALGAAGTREARLSDLLDRALLHLETREAAQGRLSDITDAALSRLEATGDQLEASLEQTARFEGLLARAVALAETGSASEEMTAATDRALTLLDDALSRAEVGQAASAKTEGLLERALAAGEQMQRDLAARGDEIKKQDAAIKTALDLSERAMALAAERETKKRGFWARLLGRD